MISSSPEGSVRGPGTGVGVTAVEWDLEELPRRGASGPVAEATPSAGEQDDLIEAIALANEARERAVSEDLEQRVAEAYARGYEEGRRTGERAEGARLRSAVEAAEEAVEALRSGESRWRGGLEENICALAVAVAKQVLGRELRGDRSHLIDLVRRAVAEFPVDQAIRIRVSPSDLAMISAGEAGGSPASLAPGREARWLADPLVSPGGCVVEGRERIVDGRVDSALERIYRRLTYTHA